MTDPDPALRVPPLTQYCYQAIVANLESASIASKRFSSFGQLPYRLAKPILESCPSELLAKLELEFTEWQANEYLEVIDVEIWQVRCLELLGPNGLSIYASGERTVPKSWRGEYATLSKKHQTAVSRATDRVSKFREAQELDQRKAKLTQHLPPIRRKAGSNPLLAISNPAFRKVVADTKKLSFGGPTGANSAYFMRPPRPISTMPERSDSVFPKRPITPTSGQPSPPSGSRSAGTSSLFIPRSRPPG